MDLQKKLDQILKQVEKPGRYIGGEVNSIKKTHEEAGERMAFAFPDLYEIGMSYLGMQILYNAVNAQEGIACERVFAPAADMESLMKENDVPLFTLETKTPLKDVDVLGFTLQYEMSFATILNMLDLAQIPLLAKDRGEEYPIVAAGGPCAFNPEPLADFMDMFLIGDGEVLLPEVLKLHAECKKNGLTKKEFLEKACKLEGVYVPSFYDVEYNEDGTIKTLCKLNENAPDTVLRKIQGSVEELPFPVKPVIPMVEAVHDRSVIETFRGCTRGCRFCQAGMIYRPVRERNTDTILNLAKTQLENTGNDELSLLSLSTSDYSNFKELTLDLMDYCKATNVSLSLPSLRIDKFAFEVLNKIQEYKKSGLTYAPEAGTQRLRDVINKGVTEEDIYTSVEQAISLGWKNIKLYFMIGLPTETYEDLDGIANIAQNIIEINKKYNGPKGGRFNLTVSVSNFVPKADTPFQWERQNTPEEFREKHNYLVQKLKIKGVKFNYHDSFTSVCEAIFARGDRRCGKALLRAHELGCRLDGWTEHFHPDRWEQAFEETGITADYYAYRERKEDEVLPWDHIDCGITKKFFLSEKKKAYGETTTHDCRHGCVGCGINRRVKCEMEGIYGK
ncbi:MAG: TIGR03960 family B12-binding radical SAM protein [Firmicutes bacterium]|nr:TIGR03960 family B12-binding radical SAM protein [Bacillota bacterium]